MSGSPGDRAPRWYLWEGGFLAVGRSRGVIPPHSHHAVQVSLAVEGSIRVAGQDAEWETCDGVIIRPNAIHSFDADGTLGAMLFVDPQSREGAWLTSSVMADITPVPAHRIAQCRAEIATFISAPLDALGVAELIQHCVRALSAGVPPSRRVDPRIAGVLASLRASETLRVSLEDAAATVFLSPGRFAHLFAEHVGLPFRRYLLWRKVTRAMMEIGNGRTLTEAAHAADFADGAHLTRTFKQTFGIPPSMMMYGEFFEVPAPFEPAG